MSVLNGLFYELLFIGTHFSWLIPSLLWILVLLDCLRNEPDGSDKIAWTLFILMVPLIGALCYFLVRRPERKRAYGK